MNTILIITSNGRTPPLFTRKACIQFNHIHKNTKKIPSPDIFAALVAVLINSVSSEELVQEVASLRTAILDAQVTQLSRASRFYVQYVDRSTQTEDFSESEDWTDYEEDLPAPASASKAASRSLMVSSVLSLVTTVMCYLLWEVLEPTARSILVLSSNSSPAIKDKLERLHEAAGNPYWAWEDVPRYPFAPPKVCEKNYQGHPWQKAFSYTKEDTREEAIQRRLWCGRSTPLGRLVYNVGYGVTASDNSITFQNVSSANICSVIEPTNLTFPIIITYGFAQGTPVNTGQIIHFDLDQRTPNYLDRHLNDGEPPLLMIINPMNLIIDRDVLDIEEAQLSPPLVSIHSPFDVEAAEKELDDVVHERYIPKQDRYLQQTLNFAGEHDWTGQMKDRPDRAV